MTQAGQQIHRLILHPRDAEYAPVSPDEVVKPLREAGFIGAALDAGDGGEQAFLSGERFLQLLTFMGCSPHIEFAPRHEGDRDFCHIVLSPVYARPRFRRHEQDVFARCPACGRRLGDWQKRIEDWRADSSRNSGSCAHCHEDFSLYDLRWRQRAGFARFFIDVFSVYPQEGIPAPGLLSALTAASGQEWVHFYGNR